MFLLARKFWGKLGGSLSAIFYAFAPYHALDFYVRGAMGEMWALMFFPAVFWALTKLKEKVSIGNMLLSGVCLAGLFISHNLSTMIFLPFLVLWTLVLFLKNRDLKFIYFSFLSLLLGIAISAFYFFPMLTEKDLVHVETTTYGYFGYTEHFKGLKDLFVKRFWGYGSSIREIPGGETEDISFQIGWVHLLGWILALFSVKLFWKTKPNLAKAILVLSFAGAFSIFMIHPRSQFIWDRIPPLKYIQFPWRFLLLVIFFLSFLSGSILDAIKKRGWSIKIWIGLTVLVVALNFSYFKPEKFLNVTDGQLLTGSNWDKQIKRSIFDYLPIYAKAPPAELATTRFEILTGDVKVSNYYEGTNWISFNADAKTHTIIRLSQYYFLDWKIFIDGKETKIDYKSNGLGLMTIILGKGTHEVRARLYDTQIRTISNNITVGGIALAFLLFIIQFEKVRKLTAYYRKRIN